MKLLKLSKKTNKIGVFGGSFNPLHKGHLQILAQVQKITPETIIIPNYKNPLEIKNNYLASKLRWEILTKVLGDIKNIHLCDYELKQKKAVPSFKTLTELKKHFPNKELYFVLGADAFSRFNQWKNAKEIRTIVYFILFQRKNFPIAKTQMVEKDLLLKNKICDIQSSTLRLKIKDYLKYIKELKSYAELINL